MSVRRTEENLNKKENVYMKGRRNNGKELKPFCLKHQNSKRDSHDDSIDNDGCINVYSDDTDYGEIMKFHPKYGSCMEVTCWTFEEKVERAPKEVISVMNIYQDVCLLFFSVSFFFFFFFCTSISSASCKDKLTCLPFLFLVS